MSLKLVYYGQNDGTTVPDVTLTGDPGVDQPVLAAANYKGGVIMALKTSATSGRGVVIFPADGDSATLKPFGVLLNGGGEFSGAIGPSGSKKAPVVRAFPQYTVDAEGYDAGATFVVGQYVYCGGTGNSIIGLHTDGTRKGTNSPAIGICTHIPTAAEPYLGVAGLL